MKNLLAIKGRFIRRLCCLLAAALAAGLLALPAGAVGFTPTCEVYAEAAYIVNTDTNLIIYEKKQRDPPARCQPHQADHGGPAAGAVRR